MGRRVLLGAALLVAVLSGAPAAAQEPVEGGGSFSDAPLLAAGRYSDTIRPTETLFYAVDLRRGEQMTFSARFVGDPDREYDGHWIELSLHTPTREEVCCDESVHWDTRDIQEVSRSTEPIGLTSDRDFERDGPYYLSVFMDEGDRGVNQQFAMTITVAVEAVPTGQRTGAADRPVVEQAPPAPDQPDGPDQPPGTLPPEAPAADHSGPGLGLQLLVGAGSFLVGGLLGALLMALRSPGSPPVPPPPGPLPPPPTW